MKPRSVSLREAIKWTRVSAQTHYATAVRAAGWGLGGWEAAIDRFHNPGVFTAAAGMVLFKTVIGSNGKNGKNGKGE